MRIVMVASESNPLCKTGGLADVVYSLSRELVNNGHEVFVFVPFYKSLKNKGIPAVYSYYDYVDMSWRHQYIGVFNLEIDGIKFKLIDNDLYFNRDNLYGYDDDGERFAYFSLAVQKIIHHENLKPDIVHVHDWQAGMLPALMKGAPLDNYKIHFVQTIHNPAFKGFLDKSALGDLYNLSDDMYDSGAVRLDNAVSTLKAGIYFADKLTTVSPTHRNELLTKELSQGLNEVLELRKDDFVGIVNGIDVKEFDPITDKKIAANYSAKAFLSGKKACKQALLDYFNIPNKEGPTFGLVSRLTWQKGISLILQNAKYLIDRGANIIFLGSGEKNLEEAIESLRRIYPNQVGVYIGYNDDIAHKVYAGSDFFLMPSLFEPCGIGQIIAQRYGSLPIVRETGGLKDTVHAEIDGFSFADYDPLSMYNVVKRALDVYYMEKPLFKELVKNALSIDHSWSESMNKYLDVFKESMKKWVTITRKLNKNG